MLPKFVQYYNPVFILPCIFLLGSISLKAQTAIFFDGFEGGALTNNWVLEDVYEPDSETLPNFGWGKVNANFGAVGKRGGTNKLYCAALRHGGTTTSPTYPDETTGTAIWREIDLTGYHDAYLSFWYIARIPESSLFMDSFDVYINGDPVFSTWDLWEPVKTWTQVTIPLRDYVGEVITLRFEFNTDEGNESDPDFDTYTKFDGVYLDDVLVYGDKNRFIPDYNKDGNADIIFQHTDGRIGAWNMNINGTPDFLTNYVVRSIATAWKVVGHSDLDWNGSADVIFQHNIDGRLAAWMMNGSIQQSIQFLPAPNAGWKAVAMNDYNNDGHRDFIWQHTDGRMAVWYMNGTLRSSAQSINKSVTKGWIVAGVADFDYDGYKDILLQRTSDSVLSFWKMSGLNYSGTGLNILAGTSGVVFKGWQVVQITDFNHDGHIDLLVQHTDGRTAVWFLNERTIVTQKILRGGIKLPPGWIVIGPK